MNRTKLGDRFERHPLGHRSRPRTIGEPAPVGIPVQGRGLLTSRGKIRPRISIHFPPPPRAFTLIELLLVVAVIAVLAAIAMVNYQLGIERSLKASDASNLRTLAVALQSYMVDFDEPPPADRVAGGFMSHGPEFTAMGNGPAGGGSWDGVPWILIERGYVTDWKTMFCPKYLKLYSGGTTVGASPGGPWPRYHNFRYAYNASAVASGGIASGTLMTGTSWILRDLWIGPQSGWWGGAYPAYPADYGWPWGEGDETGNVELALYWNAGVKPVLGGTEKDPKGP